MIHEVTMYKVVCDYTDCKRSTIDLGGEFSAWSEASHAVDEWENYDQLVTEDGKHYCDKHQVPTCAECNDSRVVANSDPDDEGDWFCEVHAKLAEDQP